MPQLGKFIRRITKLQKGGRPMFYLAENVVLRNKAGEEMIDGDLNQIKTAFRIDFDPIKFDAKYVSPCKRNRHYITNIPLYGFDDFDFDGPVSRATPTCCFDDGYTSPVMYYDRNMHCKANAFMASLSRQNDDRMILVKDGRNMGELLSRTVSIVERERLMGLPEGYVSIPVKALYKELLINAFIMEAYGRHWKDMLDPKYHCFVGAYCAASRGCYSFEASLDGDGDGADPVDRIQLKMVAVDDPKRFLTADEYCLRLIGNAFSIPAVEMFLKPLQQVYSIRSYNRFNYCYKWIKQGPASELKNKQPKPHPATKPTAKSAPKPKPNINMQLTSGSCNTKVKTKIEEDYLQLNMDTFTVQDDDFLSDHVHTSSGEYLETADV
jgi:hypothetical protein